MNQDNLVKIEECFRDASIDGDLCSASITKYADSIKNFFSIIGDKRLEELSVNDFKDYISLAREKGASNSRIANVISAVKWVIKKLQDGDIIPKTLDLEKVKKPKIERKEVVSLTEAEVNKFLDCILEDISKGAAIRKIRMMALIMFLTTSGSRIGEALSINISKINWEEKEIPIIGKGKKPRKVYLHERVMPWIKEYLDIRKSQHEALFLTLGGTARWSQTDVGKSFRRYRDMSGINKEFTLHTFRHSFATILAKKGVPFNVIQKLLGHSRLETTVKYYIGAVEDDAAKEAVQDRHFDFISETKLKDIEPIQ